MLSVLLLPLLGGYLFCNNSERYKYRLHRRTGYDLFFLSAVAGVLLGTVGLAVVMLVWPWLPLSLQSFPFLSTNLWGQASCLIAFALGKPLGLLSNKICFDSEEEIRREIEEDGDALEQLLDRSIGKSEEEDDRELLMVTLKSSKVYIGFATENPDPYGDRKYFRLLKVGSGCRTRNQGVEITTSYRAALNAFDALNEGELDPEKAEPFQTVIPKNEVAHASLFLPDIADHLEDAPSA